MRDNENITATEENTVGCETVDIELVSTRQCDETLEYEHISTKQCSAYGIEPGMDDDDMEYYETLESEHISINQCSAYGVVPETDADNTYEN